MAERRQSLKHLKIRSSIITDGPTRSPNRAQLRDVGFTDDDFDKPLIGVASTWSETLPCNVHIDELARQAKAGAREAGGAPMIFNTITVSDAIGMGTEGMRYSLVSREVIADSIETVAGAAMMDGLVTIGGCDKNMPGCLIAISRIGVPAVFVYGGTILPGEYQGREIDIVISFEAVGQYNAGQIGEEELAHRHRVQRLPGTRSVRRHVYGEHNGRGDRGDGHEPSRKLFQPGGLFREASGLFGSRESRDPPPRAGHLSEGHHDEAGL